MVAIILPFRSGELTALPLPDCERILGQDNVPNSCHTLIYMVFILLWESYLGLLRASGPRCCLATFASFLMDVFCRFLRNLRSGFESVCVLLSFPTLLPAPWLYSSSTSAQR